ncbi:MAG TPA: 16S rRNA (uracil(1498)-N(3))-methyltransferase, partial [Burkholderiaceae bacterium]|nr:16S rRNA (uracil(1498)-N(3))-methyltransferase [Burkholderiaceae bacterium]
VAGQELALPDTAARHAQVLRLQPGESLVLFNGQGGEWCARIARMGRRDVQVRVLDHVAVDRELPLPVTLSVGMPANERFEWLIEKATELGVATVEPLVCERSVVRSAAERAQRKLEHWRGVAVAAAEQCGRTRVPRIAPVQPFAQWLKSRQTNPDLPLLLLAFADAQPLGALAAGPWLQGPGLRVLSGPEGGLSPTEEQGARALGDITTAVRLGPRVLRAETAPLAVLATLASMLEKGPADA